MADAVHTNDWRLFRVIIPAFPRESIFTGVATKITGLGAVMVATIVSKIWGWNAEVVDENNYNRRKYPVTKDGFPDHAELQRRNPADVVGLYCGMSCIIERAWQIADTYKKFGITVVAGGWHAKDLPEETLSHNVDAVFYGKEGEPIARSLIEFFTAVYENKPWENVGGIYLLKAGRLARNPLNMGEAVTGYDASLDRQPFPNYGLVKYCYKLRYFTIRRLIGCDEDCEFCRVKDLPRWASAVRHFRNVQHQVETSNARRFFCSDDNSGIDRQGWFDFWTMIEREYGNSLDFGVQVRVDIAKDEELVNLMVRAGVTTLYIGLESPIDEDLAAMGKGYDSADMIRWIRVLVKKFRHVHGMFIVNYPWKGIKSTLSASQIFLRFKTFIKRAGLTSIQVFGPGPLLKTGLRARMQKEGRLLPLEIAPWNKYDGLFPLILPDGNMTFEEFQELPINIMKWFYSRSYLRIFWRACASLQDLIIGGWRMCRRKWRREAVRYFGYSIVRKWQQRKEKEAFSKKVRAYLTQKKN